MLETVVTLQPVSKCTTDMLPILAVDEDDRPNGDKGHRCCHGGGELSAETKRNQFFGQCCDIVITYQSRIRYEAEKLGYAAT